MRTALSLTLTCALLISVAAGRPMGASSSWHVQPTPKLTGGLTSVSALSVSNVFAVGSQAGGGLAEHWDGAAWTVLNVPNPAKSCVLSSVAAVALNDAWAAGFCDGVAYYLLHWDGTVWSMSRSY